MEFKCIHITELSDDVKQAITDQASSGQPQSQIGPFSDLIRSQASQGSYDSIRQVLDQVENRLNTQYGSDGWQLVSVTPDGTLFLQRQNS